MREPDFAFSEISLVCYGRAQFFGTKELPSHCRSFTTAYAQLLPVWILLTVEVSGEYNSSHEFWNTAAVKKKRFEFLIKSF